MPRSGPTRRLARANRFALLIRRSQSALHPFPGRQRLRTLLAERQGAGFPMRDGSWRPAGVRRRCSLLFRYAVFDTASAQGGRGGRPPAAGVRTDTSPPPDFDVTGCVPIGDGRRKSAAQAPDPSMRDSPTTDECAPEDPRASIAGQGRPPYRHRDGRQTGLPAQRRFFSGIQNHGAIGCQRWAEFPNGRRQRTVPGNVLNCRLSAGGAAFALPPIQSLVTIFPNLYSAARTLRPSAAPLKKLV